MHKRYILSFLILAMTVGINVGQHLLEQLSIDRNYLIIALIALVVAGLIAHTKLFFIVLIVALTGAINLPPEMLAQYGINPDILFATLLAVIVAPTASKLVGWRI